MSVDMVGRKVFKKSMKPFKSMLRVNTVKGIIPHPMCPGKLAYIFEEDDSYVSCESCSEYKSKLN
jgi:hypothetical protein